MPRNGDQFFTYRQSSDFFYLTGINQEKSILIMNPSHPDPKRREVLLILRPTPEMETWNGHKLTTGRNTMRFQALRHVHYPG